MPEGICNKCGEQNELVFADCICCRCSNSLDQHWTGVTATDWILIVTHHSPLLPPVASGTDGVASAGGDVPPETPFRPYAVRHGYRNTTYAEMKSLWATRHKCEGSFRPATAEEIADKELWTLQIYWESSEIFNKWGFDDEVRPLIGDWDNDAVRRYDRAVEEIEKRIEQLGLHEPYWHYLGLGERIRASQGHTPGHGLSQVVGMADLKEQLMHEVIGPFKDPELYRRYRVSLPNGILFYGPPGCGKTYIARSLAEELGWSFQYCRPSDVASPYIHDTVSRIRGVFSSAFEKALQLCSSTSSKRSYPPVRS
jgi:hypothetical protein